MKTLVNVGNGKKVKIIKISGGRGVRQHLQCLGIHIGDIVILKKVPS